MPDGRRSVPSGQVAIAPRLDVDIQWLAAVDAPPTIRVFEPGGRLVLLEPGSLEALESAQVTVALRSGATVASVRREPLFPETHSFVLERSIKPSEVEAVAIVVADRRHVVPVRVP